MHIHSMIFAITYSPDRIGYLDWHSVLCIQISIVVKIRWLVYLGVQRAATTKILFCGFLLDYPGRHRLDNKLSSAKKPNFSTSGHTVTSSAWFAAPSTSVRVKAPVTIGFPPVKPAIRLSVFVRCVFSIRVPFVSGLLCPRDTLDTRDAYEKVLERHKLITHNSSKRR